MTIQAIGGINHTQNFLRTDFGTLAQSMKAVQDAENSGNQDRVTLSQSALVQAAARLQNDIGITNQSLTSGDTRIQNLQNDLQTLQNALISTGHNQGASSQGTIDNAMGKVASDVSALQKGHGFRHRLAGMMHASNPGNSANNNDTISSLAALFGVGTASQSQNE